MSSRTRTRLLAGAVVITLLAAGCGNDGQDSSSPSGGSSEAAGSEGLTTIRIGVLGSSMSNTLDYIADDNGFFEERGLDAEITQVANAPDALAAALRGEFDVFLSAAALLVPAAANGECFNVVTYNQRAAYNIIVSNDVPTPNADKPFPENLQDLEGLTIGAGTPGAALDTLTRYILSQGGLDPDEDVEFVSVPLGTAAATALLEGQVDALTTYPPVEQALGADNFKYVAEFVGDPESPLAEYMLAPNAATCDLIEEQPETLLAYCQAIADAYDYAQDESHAEAIATTLSNHMPTEPDIATALWETYSTTFVNGEITEETWEFTTSFLPEDTPDAPYEDWVYEPCAGGDPRS